MQKENTNQTWFPYTKGIVWKVLLAIMLVLLTERFIWNGMAHPSHHHHHHDDVKPIFKALCVIFTILLIYLVVQDCRDIYQAFRDWNRTVVKPPSSSSTSVAQDRPITVANQV
ncbi:hypothetical protein ACSBR1_009778 [Camellia fascicularis]